MENNLADIDISLRTEEINELLGRRPNSILRWGSTVILLVVLGFFLLLGRFNYSETIRGAIQLSLPGKYSPDSTLYGKALFPIQSSGKIAPGQAAVIRLGNYPSEEFGVLQGTIESVNPLPVNRQFEVIVRIRSMRTSNSYPIGSNIRELEGDIIIIIKKEHFFRRLI